MTDVIREALFERRNVWSINVRLKWGHVGYCLLLVMLPSHLELQQIKERLRYFHVQTTIQDSVVVYS